jgi:hypothetical protein
MLCLLLFKPFAFFAFKDLFSKTARKSHVKPLAASEILQPTQNKTLPRRKKFARLPLPISYPVKRKSKTDEVRP